MLGITDEHIAHRKLDIGDLAAGHEKYDTEYVLDQEPDIIILVDYLTAEPLGEAAYGNLGGVFIPALTDMLGNERLLEEYERRSVQLEDKWLNLLVRKDAKTALAATQPAPP
jgi:flagellar basal body-associated protein FliL